MSKQREVVSAVRFKRNAEEFINTLAGIFQARLDAGTNLNMKNINVVALYIEHEEKEQLLTNFIINTRRYWEHIYDKDDSFFSEHWVEMAPEKFRKNLKPYVDCVKDEDGGLNIKQKSLTKLWMLTHNMVKCSLHYINENRKKFDGSLTGDLEKLAEKWTIELGKKVYETDSDDESSEEGSDESSDDE